MRKIRGVNGIAWPKNFAKFAKPSLKVFESAGSLSNDINAST